MAGLTCRRLASALTVGAIALGGVTAYQAATAPAAAAVSPVVSTQALYAAYTLKLTYFISWPAEAFASEEAPLVIGTFARDPINPELDAVVQGEMLNRHPIRTVRLQSLDDVAKCHVVYVSRNYARLAAAIEQCAGKPILTIGDADRFLELGGQVRFVPQPPNIRLSISPANLKRSGLEARAQLLRIAAAP